MNEKIRYAVITVVSLTLITIIPVKSQANTADALDYLIWQVAELNLQEGISNSLDAKLEAALKAKYNFNEKNKEGMINALEAFIYAVQLQYGKNISEADADYFIYFVADIIYHLENCVYGTCDIPDCPCEPPCVPPCDGSGGSGSY